MQTGVNDDWKPESGLDALLVLLYASDGRTECTAVEGITRLDKLMFLLSKTKEFASLFQDDYEFTAYNFGPYATELLDDIEALEEEGFLTSASVAKQSSSAETIDAETIEEDTGEIDVSWKMYPLKSYRLTEEGISMTMLLYNALTIAQKQKLEHIKRKFGKMPLTVLLKYVYEKFPESASKSLIKDRIMDS